MAEERCSSRGLPAGLDLASQQGAVFDANGEDYRGGGLRHAGLPLQAQEQTFLETETPVFRSLVLPSDAAAAAASPGPTMGAGVAGPPSFGGVSGPPSFGGGKAFGGPQSMDLSMMDTDDLGKLGLQKPSFGGFGKPSFGGAAVDTSAWTDNFAPPETPKPVSAIATAPATATTDFHQTRVLPLPHCARLEPNSHFFVRGTAPDLAAQLSQALRDANVDTVFKAEKGKWKAKYYSQCHRFVDFRVRLFQQSGRLVCEFQRREGCGIVFRDVFSRVKERMASDFSVVVGVDGAVAAPAAPAAAGPAKLSNFEAARLVDERLQVPAASEQASAETMSALTAMAAGPFAGARAEALRVFAGMTSNSEGASSVRSAQALPACVEALRCPCPDARRSAAVCAANLSEHGLTKGALVDAGAIPALLAVATDAEQAIDARREAARGLANLSDAYATEILAAGGAALSEMLNACDAIADQRLRGHAMRAHTRIVAVQ